MEEFKGKAELDRYLAKLRADGLSERTIRKNRDYLRICLTWLNKKPSEITIEDIDRWKYEMVVNRRYEPETIWASIVVLRKFLRVLGFDTVANQIKLPKRPRVPPPEKEIWLLPEEQRRLIDKSREMNVRTHAIITLFLSSGVRLSELRNIDIEDIDFDRQTIKIRHGKGDRSRMVCFDAETKNALIEYLKYRREPADGSNALFVSHFGKRLSGAQIETIVKECAVLAGIKKPITPHKLRHTFITTVIEKTKDIPLAQKLAGHTEIRTTMRYHHSTHEEIVEKYRKFLNEPAGPLVLSQRCAVPTDEILRGLDAKFIKGELPLEAYMKIRSEYERNQKANKNRLQMEAEVAGYL
jgi:site-specific recombinase XerD